MKSSVNTSMTCMNTETVTKTSSSSLMRGRSSARAFNFILVSALYSSNVAYYYVLFRLAVQRKRRLADTTWKEPCLIYFPLIMAMLFLAPLTVQMMHPPPQFTCSFYSYGKNCLYCEANFSQPYFKVKNMYLNLHK